VETVIVAVDGDMRSAHNKNMAESFDPYLQWLGISDPKRPPNHYRLLGLDRFESDCEVIQNAADRQMTHVRRFQGGKHTAESQRLLNELASAKVCLLNAEKKAIYDASLEEVEPELRVVTPPPIPTDDSPAVEVSIPSMPLSLEALQGRQSGNSVAIIDSQTEPHTSRFSTVKKLVFSLSPLLSILGAVLAVLLGLFVLWSNAHHEKEDVPPAPKAVENVGQIFDLSIDRELNSA
jgi:hypothetical protein